ncbi:uncharacterized protein ATNIH1004_004047 [Aspergillus tanneri]|uniref:Histidine-specific methyltransferase SAM-dependent domain-containing protein n=1 Tax=Aspergillus tanneri TaxID=1220188 RepID=A0A5M9MRZ6_9EURO|nr:uncharacterized protein ATNIH1004_004047 [Aspergillus tanneri]KAA8648164.1 hypothetical protein ATNIH1004_004047 [Aspergillus tanneri]
MAKSEITSSINIIDIRSEPTDGVIQKSLHDSIRQLHQEQASLPNLLLWNEEGLRCFEKITYSDDYYLTSEEIDILRQSCHKIAARIPSGSILVELGSGNLRKIKVLLDALDSQGRDVDYFALDLSLPELRRTLSLVSTNNFAHVRCFGLLGTYDDGRKWLQRPEQQNRSKVIASLGSTLGSMQRDAAAEFLASFTGQLGGASCPAAFLLGLDGCTDGKRVHSAYNDPAGLNRKFIKNGLVKANHLLGYEAFRLQDWGIVGEWDASKRSHNQYYHALTDTRVGSQAVQARTKVLAVHSLKYDDDDKRALWNRAGVMETERWTSSSGQYHIHLLEMPRN